MRHAISRVLRRLPSLAPGHARAAAGQPVQAVAGGRATPTKLRPCPDAVVVVVRPGRRRGPPAGPATFSWPGWWMKASTQSGASTPTS